MGNPRVTLRGVFGTVLLLLALLPAACGDNDIAPKTATGVSAGTVARFVASRGISVNGIGYDMAAADIVIDNAAGQAEEALEVGMRVVVTGPVNEAAETGQADRVEVVKAVQGPLDDGGISLANKTVSVMGRPVLVLPTAVFDNVAGLAALAAIQDNVPGRRPVVEVHGALDNTVAGGRIHATYIRLRADDFDPAEPVLVRGIVTTGSITGTTFRIGSLTVGFPGSVPGLTDGSFVEVTGTFVPVVATITATRPVRVLSDRLGSTGDAVRLDGYVVEVTATSPPRTGDFTMIAPTGPQEVRTNNETDFVDGLLDNLAIGARLVAEGELTAFGLLARRVRFIGPNPVAMRNTPAAVDAFGGTMTLMTKAVTVDAFTLFQDGALGNRPFSLADIEPNRDTVRVVGHVDDVTGDIAAALVDRVDTVPAGSVGGPDILLQGTVEEENEFLLFLTILGIEVDLNPDATGFLIRFLDRDGTELPQDLFFDSIGETTSREGEAVVSVERGTFIAEGPPTFIPPGIPPPMTLRIETINE